MKSRSWFAWFGLCLGLGSLVSARGADLSVDGVHVVPHLQSSEMRYRQQTDFSLGARVEVFLRNTSQESLVIPSAAEIRLRGRTPDELLKADEWAWHDLPNAPPDIWRPPVGAASTANPY